MSPTPPPQTGKFRHEGHHSVIVHVACRRAHLDLLFVFSVSRSSAGFLFLLFPSRLASIDIVRAAFHVRYVLVGRMIDLLHRIVHFEGHPITN